MRDSIERARTFLHHFPIGKPKYAITAGIQVGCPLGVVGDRVVRAVLVAVQFDNQLGAMAAEVGHVSAKRCLAAEVQPDLFEIAKTGPQNAFGIGRVLTKRSGKFVGHTPTRIAFGSPTSPQGGG